jgi:hypothetical protein
MARMTRPVIVDGARLPRTINDQVGYLLGLLRPRLEWQGLPVQVQVPSMPTNGAIVIPRNTRITTILKSQLINQAELPQIYPPSRMIDMILLLLEDTPEIHLKNTKRKGRGHLV